MASVRQHLLEARTRMRALEIHLSRIAELDGARNPEAMYPNVRDAICSAAQLAHDLTPLRCRLSLQIDRKNKAKKAGKAAK